MASPLTSATAPATLSAGRPGGADRADQTLRDAAEKLESAFLSEMLKAAGVGKPRENFGGGAGEEQFSSFLRETQAGAMVKAGGIGLAQSLFEALKERADAAE